MIAQGGLGIGSWGWWLADVRWLVSRVGMLIFGQYGNGTLVSEKERVARSAGQVADGGSELADIRLKAQDSRLWVRDGTGYGRTACDWVGM